ncbi:hypothetical protein ACH5RR_014243 [Cinchona calisaya]|uniref:BAG family molecular chaperone regulator 8, chloroplastic n=1 Tax=Cinchona calisaya TaxID=153742 RepID=A0ABD3A2C6_9GENT
MASHHHHCHPATTASTVCYCCCPNNNPSHHHPPLPDLYPLHHYQPPLPQTNLFIHYPNAPIPNPPRTNQIRHHHHHHQHLHQQPQYHHSPPTDLVHQLHDHDPVVSSLLRRIAALESSLRHHSSSHSHSLLGAAARTIQTHFRAFLVRRSRTLRQLKNLASVKSTLHILKSSVSQNPHFDPQSVSRKVLKLLLKLDSILGCDPMIRDGKMSISRELTVFLDLIERVTVKKSEISPRLVKKNATRKCGGLYNNDAKSSNLGGFRNSVRNERLKNLVDRIESLSTKITDDDDVEIPDISQNRIARSGRRNEGVGAAKVKKSVSFVEDGKVYQVRRSGYGVPVLVGEFDGGDGSDSDGAEGEVEDDVLHGKAEEVGRIAFKKTEDDEEDQLRYGQSTESSDGERGPVYELMRNEGGGFTFSAPLPVKMETRTDMMDKRKNLK